MYLHVRKPTKTKHLTAMNSNFIEHENNKHGINCKSMMISNPVSYACTLQWWNKVNHTQTALLNVIGLCCEYLFGIDIKIFRQVSCQSHRSGDTRSEVVSPDPRWKAEVWRCHTMFTVHNQDTARSLQSIAHPSTHQQCRWAGPAWYENSFGI